MTGKRMRKNPHGWMLAAVLLLAAAGLLAVHSHQTAADAAVQAAVDECTAELGDSGRVLLRKSGTEPVLRVMAEAGTAEECEKQVDRIIAAMEKSGHLIEVKK